MTHLACQSVSQSQPQPPVPLSALMKWAPSVDRIDLVGVGPESCWRWRWWWWWAGEVQAVTEINIITHISFPLGPRRLTDNNITHSPRISDNITTGHII